MSNLETKYIKSANNTISKLKLFIQRAVDNYCGKGGIQEVESDSFNAIVWNLHTSNQQIWASPHVDMPTWMGRWLLGDFGEDGGHWDLFEMEQQEIIILTIGWAAAYAENIEQRLVKTASAASCSQKRRSLYSIKLS